MHAYVVVSLLTGARTEELSLTSDCAGTNPRGSQRGGQAQKAGRRVGPQALLPAVWTRLGTRLVMSRSGHLRTRPCNASEGSGAAAPVWPLHVHDADGVRGERSSRQRSLEPRRGAARAPSCCAAS
jgi:hypothetical protein